MIFEDKKLGTQINIDDNFNKVLSDDGLELHIEITNIIHMDDVICSHLLTFEQVRQLANRLNRLIFDVEAKSLK